MQKHSNVDPTFLVCLEQAGLDILYAFMLADGHIDESEFEIVKEYLSTDFVHKSAMFNPEKAFYSECNFNKEFNYLKTLDKEMLDRRFKKAATSIEEWLKDDPETKKNIFQYAVRLIHADKKITPEEQEYLDILRNTWKLS